MNVEEVYNRLSEVKDLSKKAGMEAYMRNKFDFLGVQALKRKKSTATLFKKEKKERLDWDFIYDLYNSPYREMQYVANDYINYMEKYLRREDFFKLLDLVTIKSWWDTVDILAKPIGLIIKKNNNLENEMIKLSKNDNLWLRRISIIYQLKFKEETNVDVLSQVIKNNKDSEEFFINKAIGWSLREYSKTNPEFVIEFLSQNKLSKLSIREAKKYL